MRAVDRIKNELQDQGKERDWRDKVVHIRRRRVDSFVELNREDLLEACRESPKKDGKIEALQQGSEDAMRDRVTIRTDDAFHLVDSYD